jgi:hypothetical protein
VGIIPEIILRVRRRSVAALVCLAVIMLAADANAGMPRVAKFNYNDSLAVEVDCSGLFTDRRIELLHNGYPLTFILTLSLFEEDRLWFDSETLKISARFRIVYQRWNERILLELSDFEGEALSDEFESLTDIAHVLEERLFTVLEGLSKLNSSRRYYFEIEVQYRNLTFEDVKAADKWLKNGDRDLSADSTDGAGGSLGEGVLGFLWDIVGLQAEKKKTTTEKFRLDELRHGD